MRVESFANDVGTPCEGEASVAEQLAGKPPQTQFGRAIGQLGIKLILAHSPQAKGGVERMNGRLQDRLVKEMQLAGINDMESANRFLDRKYLRRKTARKRCRVSQVSLPRKGPFNFRSSDVRLKLSQKYG